jgi:chromosome partitioning protein
MTEAVFDSRPWILPVCNQKGGSGKTTTALNLAAVIADSSGRVRVYDADPQQSATEIAGAIEGGAPFEILDGLRPDALARLPELRGFDTVLIDCAGNLQDTPLLAEVLAVADFALIPMVPERACVVPTLKTARVVAASGIPYRIVLTMCDPLRGPGPVIAARQLLDDEGVPYFRSFIRRKVAFPQSQLDGVLLPAYRGDRSWRDALDDVRKVQTELLLELGRIGAQASA